MRQLLVCPTFVWTGLELAFWNGEYTQLLDQSVIGLVMLWVGVAEVRKSCSNFSSAWLNLNATVFVVLCR